MKHEGVPGARRQIRRRVVKAPRKFAILVYARWAFDSARDPVNYPDVELGDVTREAGNVLVLRDQHGDVLTRYTYCGPVNLAHIERRAFACLSEL